MSLCGYATTLKTGWGVWKLPHAPLARQPAAHALL